jgi:hypothetical protein
MKQLLLVVFFFPLLAFCIAGVTELRSSRSRGQKLSALIPLILGLAAFGLSLDPANLLSLNVHSSVTLSRVMTMVSALIACSGVFVAYSRRSSAIWVACGGLVLAFFWMFNRVLA